MLVICMSLSTATTKEVDAFSLSQGTNCKLYLEIEKERNKQKDTLVFGREKKKIWKHGEIGFFFLSYILYSRLKYMECDLFCVFVRYCFYVKEWYKTYTPCVSIQKIEIDWTIDTPLLSLSSFLPAGVSPSICAVNAIYPTSACSMLAAVD